MNFPVLLLTLSVLVISQAAVLKGPETRANLIVGGIATGDRLLYSRNVFRAAAINTIQTEDVTWRGNSTTRISYIQALENGVSQNATARIIAGGLRASNVTVRFQSARGRGYNYNLNIWGR